MQTFRTLILFFVATFVSLQLFAQPNSAESQNEVQPLYVVDGVVVHGKKATPDPIWVKKVDRVEGEIATSEYGEEGVNGVVKITTKYDTLPIFSSDIKRRMTPYINSKIEWKEEYDRIKFRFTVGVDGKMEITEIIESSHDALTSQVKQIIQELPNWESPAMNKGVVVVAKGVMTLNNPAHRLNKTK